MSRPDTEQYCMTQAEVAARLGVSQSRIYQIEKTALRKLRKRLAERLGYKLPGEKEKVGEVP